MLPRGQKLSRKSFPSHREPKTSWRGIFLLFRYTQTNTQHHPRFAVVISKKVIQKAVERNKVRRIVYESLRVQKSFFPSWNGAKIVISVQKAGKELTKDIIFTEVQRFFDLKKQK